MKKEVILTGLRANNDLHIGNYFGAILPIIDMAKTRSDEFQVNMFIPDLHSFTTPIDVSGLSDSIFNNAKLYVAAGLPLDKSDIHIYRQSYVPAHSELTWILDCFSGFGQLSRMTQFKDKSASSAEVSVGLFNYPVLMASDILLYGAKYVPVGDDQTQHLEFTRDIAERMNSRFGQLFVVPEPVKKQHEFFGKDQGLRIMDLADPTKKMSKSDESGKGVLFLGDSPEAAAAKIMSATTDDKANIQYDVQNQPGISNLLDILALLRGKPVQEVAGQFAGQERYGDFKKVVADEVMQFLVDFQAKLASIDEAAVMEKLASSEIAMNEQASATLLRVQQAVGLRKKG
ncbi:tryptophan--tRNA ligase [Candidatus Saccharibacteria bacterium]|nr:tryptophan--tRNA ligase [Candidatus Saccharibacteria bacterium]